MILLCACVHDVKSEISLDNGSLPGDQDDFAEFSQTEAFTCLPTSVANK